MAQIGSDEAPTEEATKGSEDLVPTVMIPFPEVPNLVHAGQQQEVLWDIVSGTQSSLYKGFWVSNAEERILANLLPDESPSKVHDDFNDSTSPEVQAITITGDISQIGSVAAQESITDVPKVSQRWIVETFLDVPDAGNPMVKKIKDLTFNVKGAVTKNLLPINIDGENHYFILSSYADPRDNGHDPNRMQVVPDPGNLGMSIKAYRISLLRLFNAVGLDLMKLQAKLDGRCPLRMLARGACRGSRGGP
jgi:hypothetical protein